MVENCTNLFAQQNDYFLCDRRLKFLLIYNLKRAVFLQNFNWTLKSSSWSARKELVGYKIPETAWKVLEQKCAESAL